MRLLWHKAYMRGWDRFHKWFFVRFLGCQLSWAVGGDWYPCTKSLREPYDRQTEAEEVGSIVAGNESFWQQKIIRLFPSSVLVNGSSTTNHSLSLVRMCVRYIYPLLIPLMTLFIWLAHSCSPWFPICPVSTRLIVRTKWELTQAVAYFLVAHSFH